MRQVFAAPSVLSADFGEMAKAVFLIEKSGGDWIHLDVMDGVFVPNLTFGPKLVKDVREASTLPFDVHLMTVFPERLVAPFAEAGADLITFHFEASIHAHRLIQEIRALGKKPGVSIVPSTPVSSLECILPFVDLVLVMTVNPGFGGQSIIPECLEKVRILTREREKKGFHFKISVDGGINRETAPEAIEAGADVLVVGNAFFSAADKVAEIKALKGFNEFPPRGYS